MKVVCDPWTEIELHRPTDLVWMIRMIRMIWTIRMIWRIWMIRIGGGRVPAPEDDLP